MKLFYSLLVLTGALFVSAAMVEVWTDPTITTGGALAITGIVTLVLSAVAYLRTL